MFKLPFARVDSNTLQRSQNERIPNTAMSQYNEVPISGTDAAALDALRLLANRPELSQRQLSRELGLSLGKTHYVLHALLDRGLVKIQNFKRSDKKSAYAYLLTPKGLSTKMQMTRRFLAHKEVEFEHLRATIARLRQEVHPNASSDTT